MSCKIAVSLAIFALVSVVALYSVHTYIQMNTYHDDDNDKDNDNDLLTSSSKSESSKLCFFKKYSIKIKDVTFASDVPSEVLCLAGDQISLDIHGRRFIDYKGKGSPREVSFTFGGTKASSVELLDCKSKKMPWWWRWLRLPICKKCSQAIATFPTIKKANELIQSVSVVAKNPKPCSSSASYPITVINQQKLNFSPTVTPTGFCINKGPYQLDIVGDGFLWIKDKYSEKKPEVFWMDETNPSPVSMDESSCTDITKVEDVKVFLCTRFTATVSNVEVPPANPRVSIVNAAPCQTTAVTQSVTVSASGPIDVLAASPPTIQDDITIQLTIIITVLPADQTVTSVIFKQGDQSISVEPDPMPLNNRVPVTISRHLLTIGAWDVVVVTSGDAPGCHASLADALNVVQAVRDSMDPVQDEAN